MPDLLLKTKFSKPVIRKDLVARPGLFEKLNTDLLQANGFSRKLILVSAPAGFGKTTLVAHWLEGLGLRAAWLSLDDTDNDPARFLAYLVAALQQIDPQIGQAAIEMQRAPQPAPGEVILISLINDLAAVDQPFILALDDYHVIQNPIIHQQVGFLLEHQPERMLQVILTREDPLLPIHRLRSREQVREIRLDDLRFAPGETANFLRIMGLNLAQADLDTLQRRTEGWVTGLQLAALSMQGFPDPHPFILSFAGSNRYILDYLFEEIYDRLPQEVQDFLIKTSILDQLAAGLCDQVVGRTDSQEQLASLERANLFIVPLDPARAWYRYHRLFKDLLRHQLNLQQDIRLEEFHRRASQWYERQGDLDSAVQHALAARDWALACRLIDDASDGMLKGGEIATLIGWFKNIPATILSDQPALGLTFAWALLLASQFDEAEPLLDHAEQLAQPGTVFLGQVAAAQAYLARAKGDDQQLIDRSQLALALLPENDWMTRGVLMLNLGLAFWHAGRLDEAEQALLEAQDISGRVGNTYALLAARIFLARIPATRGQLRQTETMIEKSLPDGGDIPILALAHYDLGVIYYEWNQLEKAEWELNRGLELSTGSGIAEFQSSVQIQRVFLALAKGEPASALATMEQAQVLARDLPAVSRSRSAACQVQLALALGDLERAAYWAEQVTEPADAHSFCRFLNLTRPRIMIASGQKQAALQELQTCYETASRAGWGYAVIAIRILQTLAAENEAEALNFLSDALQLGAPEGFIRSFADAGESMAPLLKKAAIGGTFPDYVGRILTAIGVSEAGVGLDQTSLVEPLSERELEVLRLVADGLSNREIARKLFISAGTVKTHVHHICGKLEVRNRLEAVTRAKELKLV